MWTFDHVPWLSSSDMDNRRASPNYEAGFDACDPLGSVLEWSGRGPARVIRRRCRSEGVDRSPYEDVTRELNRSADYHSRPQRTIPSKSHFTLNGGKDANYDRFRYECSFATAENGDYAMSHDQQKYHSYHAARSKFLPSDPTRALIVNPLTNSKLEDTCLPRVEELLERVDHDMMEVPVTKQPLKSILNNPLSKFPLHGILKKPKSKPYQDTKLEGRRRQRAASESDNFHCSFHIGSPIPGYENHLAHPTSNKKRAKDNSGTGYSYGTAVAALCTGPRASSPPPYPIHRYCSCKDKVVIAKDDVYGVHILRTTAITNDTDKHIPRIEMTRQETPIPTCPAVSPSLPVSSVTASPATSATIVPVVKKPVKKLKRKVRPRVKPAKMRSRARVNTNVDDETEPASRSPSPVRLVEWPMETDTVIPEVHRNQKASSAPMNRKKDAIEQNTVAKLSNKLNGAVVSPKKNERNNKEHQQFLTALHTINPFRILPSREDSLVALPETVSQCLRPSLFPRVPPYLKFLSHANTTSVKIPPQIQKHLKWKLTTITPIVVKKILINSGFRLVKSECDTSECPQDETVDWIGIWGKHMKSLMFRAIKDCQKMNHFPGTFQIGRKDRLWRNLQKLVTKYGASEFGIMPKTYVLPQDLKILKHEWEKHVANNERWIIKPPASARGTGIKVVSRWTQIPKKRPVVVQRYVTKPYLINGNKFDMRLYVLVTSVHPLRIYLYKDGLARFASVKYNDDLASLNDRYMHLTNYSINRLSKNYTPNEDFSACEGHKWTLKTLFYYLKDERGVDTDALWESLKDLVIKTIISGEASISSLTKANITSRYNCYELFGIDVLLDESLKPWLLEVNISPSLHSSSPLDVHVKGPLVATVLNIAQFQVPPNINLELLCKEKLNKLAGLSYDSRIYTVYLSKEERDKHILYTKIEDRDVYLRDILSSLTPDDVRHLIQAEDELTQTGDMERVFPTHETHKYLGFLAGPRYYNRLFDAWEERYSSCRQPGIELLRKLCALGYHLEAPAVPLQNDVDSPTPSQGEAGALRPGSDASLSGCECHSPSRASPPRSCSAATLAGDFAPRPHLPQLEPRA